MVWWHAHSAGMRPSVLYGVLTLAKGQRLPLASLSGESVPLNKKRGIGLRGTPGLGR